MDPRALIFRNPSGICLLIENQIKGVVSNGAECFMKGETKTTAFNLIIA